MTTRHAHLVQCAMRLAQEWRGDSTPSLTQPPLNTVANPFYLEIPEWKKYYDALAPTESWQHAHILYGLDKLGCITPESRGLGLACAHESLLYYLTNQVASVAGIDVYDDRSGYNDKEMPDDPARFAPFECRLDRLEIKRWEAGEKFPFEDATFDFVWSVSSLEHFGAWKNKVLALSEAARVLKKGGVLAFTTELIVSRRTYLGQLKLPQFQILKEYFTRSDMEKLLGSVPRLELVDGIQWAAAPEAINENTLHIHGFLYLPIAIFLRKR
ncbi:MAG: class I SAM-dependent methyltransferase [Vulcanimicrobiota bacterium]